MAENALNFEPPAKQVLRLHATAHDSSRQDRYMCAGSSRMALGDAFQTTVCDVAKEEQLRELLHTFHQIKTQLRDWVDENGLVVGDSVLFHEWDGSQRPAVVIDTDTHASTYTVQCQYNKADGEPDKEHSVEQDVRLVEAGGDRLSLVGRN